jgi:glucosyl-dolichyl phosphate glucuronosyltransferase
METPLISVVVCTFNRVLLLERCLESLVNQSLSDQDFEVLIVDNLSTDQTPELIHRYRTHHPSLRSTVATQQGLSCARNVGWQTARGRYIAYIDDDAMAEPDWLTTMAQFIADYPEVAVFGGPYDAYTLSDLPTWFPPEYGRLSFGDQIHPIQLVEEWIPGSNMVFRRNILEQFGGFDEALGMKGTTTAYMEEIDLLLKLNAQGIEILYVPTLKVRHLIADYKMSLGWLLKSLYAAGCSAQQTTLHDRTASTHALAVLKTFGLIFVKFCTPKNLPLKRRSYYALYWFMWELGALNAYLKSAKANA